MDLLNKSEFYLQGNFNVIHSEWLITFYFAKTNTAKTVKRDRQSKCELHWCRCNLFFLDHISRLKLFWRKKKIYDKYVRCLGQLKKGTLVSVQFSHSVVSNSLWTHEPQHARPPCPSLLPEFTETHIHWLGDAIQPSHLLSSTSPPALSLSQYQGLFKWVNSLHQVVKLLEFQLQYQSFQYPQDWSPLGWTGWISLQSNGLPRVFSNTIVQKQQFFSAQPSLYSKSHIHTWPLEKS